MEQKLFLTAEQVRDFDRWAINECKIPPIVLMENAGKNFTEIFLQQLAPAHNSKILVLCGTGNNGGDGFVIARHLINKDFDVRILLYGDMVKISADAQINLNIIQNLGAEVIEYSKSQKQDIVNLVNQSDFLIDAILGTGFSGDLRDNLSDFIKLVNSANKKVAAVDIPSGLNCDSGKPQPIAIKAVITTTFAAEKKGFVNPKSAEFTGKIFVADIGIALKFKKSHK